MAEGITLDSLSLELSGDASKAQSSITGLITSLGSLSTSLQNALSQLRSVNGELRKMSSVGNITPPTINLNMASAANVNNGVFENASGEMSGYADSVNSVASASNNALVNTGRLTINIRNAGETASTATKKTSGLGQALNRVGRIFSTMIIRLGLKKVISAFSDSWTAAYNFSKSMNGEFASSVDKASTLLSKATTSIVSAFSPALTAIIPVITSVVSMIEYLCSAISWLFSLLGGVSDLFGASTDSINNYSNAASGGSSANKELLASFDELNVITSASGGGGSSGGSSYVSGLTDSITGELDALTFYIGESLLAVGLILACTGHVAIGVALMAVGAAGIAKTIITDWNNLSDDVKKQIAVITAAVGVATLALGAILAFSGANIPLGIGLMAIGAINLAAATYISWNGGVSSEVVDQIAKIELYASGAFIALGLILALSGVSTGLGITLIAAGAVGLVAAATVSWGGGVSDEVKSQIKTITAIAGGALLAIGAILTFSGANVPLGIGMLAAGGVSLVAAISPNWGSMKGKIESVFNGIRDYLILAWNNISNAVTTAWNAVKKWWEDSGLVETVRGVWSAVQTHLTTVWNSVKETATRTWESIQVWWNSSSIGEKFRTAWGYLSTFFKGLWEDISKFAGDAWISTKKWWQENVISKIEKEGVWGGVKGYFSGLWKSVEDAAKYAWDQVKQWWEKTGIGEWVRRVWSDVGNFLQNTIWTPVKNAVINAWNQVKKWWEETGVGQWISGVWTTVSNFLVNDIWNPIKNTVYDAWCVVANWWEKSGVGTWVRRVWSEVGNFLENTIWKPVSNAVTNAWNAVVDWWNANIYTRIKNAWENVKSVFQPLLDIIEQIKEGIEFISGQHVVEVVQKVTTATTQGTPQNTAAKQVTNTVTSNLSNSTNIWDKILGWTSSVTSSILGLKAEGDIGIPRGELFVAQEAGPELIGEINGKTSVANQQQIIEGIASGVEQANSEQNSLLRQQNELLRDILEKDSSVRIGASAALGRVTKQSLDMYNGMVGG